MSLSRGRAWQLFGAPAEQLGSVNDPRIHEEHGVRWNEKWVYLAADGSRIERVVFWNRYDLVGAFEIALDGGVRALDVPDA